MRILLLHKFHHRLGGAERIYFETAKLLQEAGHQVAFFSMRHPKNLPTPYEKYFVRQADYADQARSLREKIRMTFDILWNREATKKLDALITEFQPDVAHAFNVFHQLSPAVFHVLKRRQVPTVLTICDFKIISPNYFLYHFGQRKIWESTSGWQAIWDRAIKNSYVKSLVCAGELWLHRFLKSYDLVDVFLAPSAFMIEKYHALGFTREITLVHHPVEEEPPLSQSALETVPLSEDEEYYLYFGRLSPEKGVEVALAAFAKLPNQKLLIVGYGPAETELRAQADKLGLIASGRVKFLGALYGPDLTTLIKEARAVVFAPLWYENQPFALMDALALGTPVIASRIGGIPDVISHGKNGFLFESGNAEDLAKTVKEFSLLSPDVLARVKQSAAVTGGEYTRERYRDEILKIYQSLIKK